MGKNQKNLLPLLLACVFMLSACSNLDVQKLNFRANELMNKGDVDGAIARLESINDLNPNFPQTNYNLGIAYFKKNNIEKSLIYLNKAVELNPKFADAYYTMGVIYENYAVDAMNKVDTDKKNQNFEALNKILENLDMAQRNYSLYIKYSTDKMEAENTQSKVNELNMQIQKYKSELIEK